MKKFTIRQQFCYQFDNLMARGTGALIGMLGLISFVMILLVSFLVWLLHIPIGDGTEAHIGTFSELVWKSLLRTLDPGTMGGDQGHGIFLGAMLCITFGGIFVVSTLIGIITSGISLKIEVLRKGRSLVLEKNHTVILGWDFSVHCILSEIILANQSKRNACIAILADKDKIEMEDEIHTKIPDTKSTRIICRTGSPIDPDNLSIINLKDSRSIIILAGDDSNEADVQVIKTMLAISHNEISNNKSYQITAKIIDSGKFEVARDIGGCNTNLILIDEWLAKIIAHTCCQPGLSMIYTELFSFEGKEIYFKHEPTLVGKSFRECLFQYSDCAPIGLRLKEGCIKICPPMDTVFGNDDQIIAIAEDDSQFILNPYFRQKQVELIFKKPPPVTPATHRILILGWNRRVVKIIEELDKLYLKNSQLYVLADLTEFELTEIRGSFPVTKLTISVESGSTTDRKILESLDLAKYEHILVMSYSDQLKIQAADARTMYTLFLLRSLADAGGFNFSIVSEMLDMRNSRLSQKSRADDFIVSNHLISLIMAQVSENNEITGVYGDLLSPGGSRLEIKNVDELLDISQGTVSVGTLVEILSSKDMIMIGYRNRTENTYLEKSCGIHLSPNKDETLDIKSGDQIIILSPELPHQ